MIFAGRCGVFQVQDDMNKLFKILSTSLVFFFIAIPIAQAANCTSLTGSSIVAYYKTDESSGNPADSVGSRTLTNTGTVTFDAGIINNGADFGSSNPTGTRYLSNTTDNYGIDGGTMSISLWVKMNTEITSGNSQEFVASLASNTSKVNYRLLYFLSGGTTFALDFNRNQPGVANCDANDTIAALGTTNWHYIVFTYDGSTVTGYLDGTSIGSFSPCTGNGSQALDNGLNLGRNNGNASGGGGGTSYLAGHEDEIGVWNCALSSTQVTTLYNTGIGIQYPFSTFLPTSIIGLVRALWW